QAPAEKKRRGNTKLHSWFRKDTLPLFTSSGGAGKTAPLIPSTARHQQADEDDEFVSPRLPLKTSKAEANSPGTLGEEDELQTQQGEEDVGGGRGGKKKWKTRQRSELHELRATEWKAKLSKWEESLRLTGRYLVKPHWHDDVSDSVFTWRNFRSSRPFEPKLNLTDSTHGSGNPSTTPSTEYLQGFVNARKYYGALSLSASGQSGVEPYYRPDQVR
ncbi:unnamed protein product, partial [Amoebophrya sp. A120]